MSSHNAGYCHGAYLAVHPSYYGGSYLISQDRWEDPWQGVKYKSQHDGQIQAMVHMNLTVRLLDASLWLAVNFMFMAGS